MILRSAPSWTTVATATLAIAATAGGALAQSTITALPIPSGYLDTHAVAISADGSTVTGEIDNSTGNSGFYWTRSGGLVNMGNYLNGNNGFSSGVSGNGLVAVGTEFSGGRGAWKWSASTGYTPLTQGASNGAQSANFDGSVIVGAGSIAGQSGPLRWTNSNPAQVLPMLAGSSTGYATGCSASGSIVIGQNSLSDGTHAFRWVDGPGGGTTQDLGRLPASNNSYAMGISADGSVVAGYSEYPSGPGGVYRARSYRWTSAGLVDLGLPAGIEAVAPQGISADGNTIVGGMLDASFHNSAFLWTAQTGVVDLQAYLPTIGVDLTGWSLNSAWGASADGRTITGWGEHNGQDTSWVVTLAPACPADLDNDGDFANGGSPDGAVTIDDLLYFLTGFEAGSAAVDLDDGSGGGTHDGAVTIDDLLFFLIHFEAGC